MSSPAARFSGVLSYSNWMYSEMGSGDDPDPAHGPALPGNPSYPLQPGPASIGWVRWFLAFPPPVGLVLTVDGIGITELEMERVPLKRVKQCVPLVSSQKLHADPSAGTS